MADERRREAERRAATGSVEDEARLLVERVRAGELTNEQLALAAYCGHEPARLASSSTAPSSTSRAWIEGLALFGPDVVATAACALLARGLEALDPELPGLGPARAQLARGRAAPVSLFASVYLQAVARFPALGHRDFLDELFSDAPLDPRPTAWALALRLALEATGEAAAPRDGPVTRSLVLASEAATTNAGVPVDEVLTLLRGALLARALASP